MMVNEEKIEEEFNEALDNLTDDEFWEYTRKWFSVESIIDIMKNWDTEIKTDAIQEMKDIQNKIEVTYPRCQAVRKVSKDTGMVECACGYVWEIKCQNIQ